MLTFVQLLGSPAIQHDGAWQSLPKGLVAALIYYLACEGTWQTREELAYLMWADMPEDKARKNLRNLLGRIRKLDFTAGLEVEPSRIRWQVATDVASFQDLMAEDNHAQALQTYQGDFLASFQLDDAVEFSEWLESKRQKLQRLHQQAALSHVNELEAQGLHEEAAQSLEPLRQADPFDEMILRRQLQNYQASGQASLALDAFEAFKTQLIHEFGADPEQATVDLVVRIQQALAKEVTASERVSNTVDTSARKANPHHNLPSQLTPFVGREVERQRIAEQLADPNCRLLTLVAPGGMGKTRLSLAVAYEKLAHFQDGVYFIPFEAVNDPEKMPYELANTLGLNLSGQEDPKAQLFSYLTDKELLLVLDNLEHLISGVGLISELLAKTTALKILATSREQLNLRAEWLFDVSGLKFPTEDDWDKSETYAAVELFLQTAARIQSNAVVDSAYTKTVSQICELVEGMPLAIELAASWLNVLSIEEILAELRAGIDLLEVSTRDVPERHKSIRAVFEYSWRLLSASQQRSLTALSVFIGNFDREAAQHVTATLTRGLLELMSKSLIRRQSTGRFDLHPLIQQYAYAKLAETRQRLKDMLAKHSAYYLEFLSLQGDALQRGEHKAALDAVELNLNNCQQAWQWAVEAQQFDNIVASAHTLETYYSQRNKVQEGVAFFEQIVNQLDASDVPQQVPVGMILASQGWLNLRMGRHQLAEQISLRALELLRPHAYYRGIMKTLNTLGVIYDRQGEYDQARTCLEEAIDLAVTQNKPRLKASYMQNLAGIEASLGRLDEAEALYVEALANSKQLKNHVHVISILNNLGIVYQKQHKYEKSNALYEEGLALAKNMNLQKSTAYILSNMALNYAFLNQLDEARKYDEQALALAQVDQNDFLEASILRHLGELAMKQTQFDEAKKRLQRALELTWNSQELVSSLPILGDIASLCVKQGNLISARVLLNLILDQDVVSEKTTANLQELLDEIENSMSNEDKKEADLQAQSLDLAEFISEYLNT